MWKHSEIKVLRRMVGQVNAFGSDHEDEFTVLRDGGTLQGIFKSWAIPVIPFLDRGNIRVLEMLWPEIISLTKEVNFFFGLHQLSNYGGTKEIREAATTAIATLDDWKTTCVANPLHLARSLERARLYSWLLDKNLMGIFNQRPISEEPSGRINELANRLYLAFGLMNPFYNLEALVGEPKWIYGDQDKEALDTSAKGGQLDAICLLLPSIFREEIITEPLNWNGLNWQILRQKAEILMRDSMKGKILINLSRLTDLPPHHILFAVNVLEWIPKRVGGKKDDVVITKEILTQTNEQLLPADIEGMNGIAILSAMNALIRFLNWVPLIESEENFKGLNWTYASVCDTAQLLLDTVTDNPGVWQKGFEGIFKTQLHPQLVGLDAASAKGRFLLHLILNEKRIKKEFFQGIDEDWQERITNTVVHNALTKHNIQEPTKRVYPTSLVGGKPKGLSLASFVLGKDKVLGGFSISASVVESILREDLILWDFILQIEQTREVALKRILARRIENVILGRPLPPWVNQLIYSALARFPEIELWAIRASSLDERRARGIYKTVLGCPRVKCSEAVKECIASYYSPKAVLFRFASGVNDLPALALLAQPYHQDKGGVAELRDRKNDNRQEIIVSIGKTADRVTSADSGLTEWKGFSGETVPMEMTEIVQLLEKLAAVFGPLQIEWAKNNSDIVIFQMELLPRRRAVYQEKKEVQYNFHMNSLGEIDGLLTFLESQRGFVSLTLDFNNPEKFQEELFALIARFGRRIAEIHLSEPISSSSHFANICRYFGIKLN